MSRGDEAPAGKEQRQASWSPLGKAFPTDSVLSVNYALDKVVPAFAEAMK
ncbi:hypothetical protein [Streptomyces sp. NBC_01171]|nr:hypothetical protein OG448_02755 [Streptomyces sp. NBC_01171]